MGRNKDELIKLAEKITGQECKDVLTKKDALKKIACYYLGEEKEFASIADCLESIVEHGATGGSGGGGYTHKAIIGIHTDGTNGYQNEEIYLSSNTSPQQGFINGYWAVTSVSGDTLTDNIFEFNQLLGAYAYKIYTDDENITIGQTNRDRNRFSFTDNIATERDLNLYIEW